MAHSAHLPGQYIQLYREISGFGFICPLLGSKRSDLPLSQLQCLLTVPQMETVASVGIQMKRYQATIALTSPSLCENHEAL
jgi:hypothetical protein